MRLKTLLVGMLIAFSGLRFDQPAIADSGQTEVADRISPHWKPLTSLSAEETDLALGTLYKIWDCFEGGKLAPTCAKAEAVVIEADAGQQMILLRAPPYGSCGEYWYAGGLKSAPDSVNQLGCGAALWIEKPRGDKNPDFLLNGARTPNEFGGGMHCVMVRFRYRREAGSWVGEHAGDCD